MTKVDSKNKKLTTPPRRKQSDVETQDDSIIYPADDSFVHDDHHRHVHETNKKSSTRSALTGKHLVGAVMLILAGFICWDLFVTPPDQRWIRKDSSDKFLRWVESHPYWGIGAFLLVIASAVVFLIPIGTPMTVGCGYIYKGVYGWKAGIAVATTVTMLGSGIGATACFLLGRYLMRERVRKWIRKYPLFDAIDTAAAEHGLRIMAMLYLTPILPLGPVSYMCGTTSMALTSFVAAKVASLPLMLLYVFVGASTGDLLAHGADGGEDEAEKLEKNNTVILLAIVLSTIMIGLVSRSVRKELDKILERQKQDKPDRNSSLETPESRKTTDESVEMGMSFARQRRLTATTDTEVLMENGAR